MLKRLRPGALPFVCLALAAACARNVRRDERPAASERRPIAEGYASWYGPGFRGKLTASGERFDPDRRTAAHRTLPLGTCLWIENVATGHGVRVRVNDRGPYAAGRIVDVSESAARELGIKAQGVARVRLYSCT